MAKNGLGLYITDTIIYLCTKEKIYSEPVDKGLVINNRIALADDFYRFMNKVIKKYKINDSLLGKNITIIELPNYLLSDKELMNSIFEKLSFNNVRFLKYDEVVKEDTINFNEENVIITLDKKSYFLNFQLLTIKDIYNLLKNYLKSQSIYLIGNSSQLNDFFKYIENDKKIKAYTYSNNNLFIIENIQKIIR